MSVADFPNMKGLVTRRRWRARKPKNFTLLVPWVVQGIAVHYSASNADEQSDHANCAARVRAIQDFHMDGQGWDDIAYNFLVCKHGTIFEGRGWFKRSAAQGTNQGNSAYIAVCFLGDDTKGRDDVTAKGRAALSRVFTRFQERWGKKPKLRPHSSFTATSCPGDELRRFIVTSTKGR